MAKKISQIGTTTTAPSRTYFTAHSMTSATINYSPENFGDSGVAWYPKLAVDVPVPSVENLSVSAYVAKQYIKDETTFGSPDYVEWNVAANYSLAGFDLSLAYSDTDISPSADGKGESVIFSVSRSF